MKNNRYIRVLSLLLFVVVLSSCEKFLDVKPKGVDNLEGIKQFEGIFNNSMMLSIQNMRYNDDGTVSLLGDAGLPLMMGDDVWGVPEYLGMSSLATLRAYRWEDTIWDPDQDAAEWGAWYVTTYPYNLVVNGVMEVEDATEQKKREVLAEARANRAFNYLILINQFGKPYDEATAANDLGVPLVLESNITETDFERATVGQVYDFIVTELEESIPDLPAYSTVRTRLSKAAAQIILGRTYLYMGKFEEALDVLDDAEVSLNALPFTAELYDYNILVNDFDWYIPFMPEMGMMGYPGQFNSHETIYMRQLVHLSLVFSSALYIRQEVLDLFDPSDHRLVHFSNLPMFGGAALPGTQRATPFAANWGPSLPDFYLMRAECRARLNDLPGAKADLETLRVKRMPEADAEVNITNRVDMVKFVLDERQREFAGTGVRWFDMRRLHNDPEFNNLIYTRPWGSETVTLRPERLTMRIPTKILTYNPNMEDND